MIKTWKATILKIIIEDLKSNLTKNVKQKKNSRF